MFRIAMLGCGLFAFSGLASAQMTVDQKVSDFTQLAATYAKNYAPYEWKVLSQNFDLYKVKTWVDRVKASKDDLEFMDICVEYVASLNDAHDSVSFQSDFAADLGFAVDLYDGIYLVDYINRSQLRASAYPFTIGDELVSIDGVATAKWVQDNSKYGIAANTRSTSRFTADLITYRPQAYIPGAVNLPDRSAVVVKRQSGAVETYNIPWAKSGTPLFAVGPVRGAVGIGWGVSLAAFAIGWLLNIVGHAAYEKRAPAFSEDCLSFLAGPVWDLQRLFRPARSHIE